MGSPSRVTPQLLDVLAVLLSDQASEELHGWEIMKRSGRSGPTVYQILERLGDAGWLEARWEAHHPEPGKPRRRFYRLTPNGTVEARTLLAKRRPNRAAEPRLALGGGI